MDLVSASTWPLGTSIAVFIGAAAVIGLGGSKMAELADRLADRTGLGEALMGGLLLGASTSLPGVSASVTAAIDGFPALAVSNALGGIAVQTAFLAVADVFHRGANLEHAAASVENMVQATLLVVLLTLLLLFMSGPAWSIGHVHLGTPFLFMAYLYGIRLVYRSRQRPMWRPRRTAATVEDRPEREAERESLARLSIGFALAAGVVLIAGVLIARSAGAIILRTGMSESLMGGLFTAISTSLPELVTTVAAVRRGALTLAVSDIVGGNAFDVLFVCVADLAFLRGSIYHAVGRSEFFLVGLAVLLNTVLLMGLIQRERAGFANIGFESILVLIFYLGGLVLLFTGF